MLSLQSMNRRPLTECTCSGHCRHSEMSIVKSSYKYMRPYIHVQAFIASIIYFEVEGYYPAGHCKLNFIIYQRLMARLIRLKKMAMAMIYSACCSIVLMFDNFILLLICVVILFE